MTVAPVPVNLPVIISLAGPKPTPPITINTTLIELVSAQVPGYTADLPGSLIEDISSTDTLAASLSDQARVELINSITPYGANEFLLNQLGQQAGLMLGQPTNTSVNVVFSVSANSASVTGFVIPTGFCISDGTQQYVVLPPGGVTGSGGTTQPLTCVAINPGSWPVPANTVDQTVTSSVAPYVITCNNPNAGTPGQLNPESWSSYRTRVLTAAQAGGIGMPSALRTALGAVPGVVWRSISIQTINPGQWTILAEGGDEYQMAFAIYNEVLDLSTLVGSVNLVTGITRANPGVVTTDLFHGLTTGETATISDSSPTNYNGSYTITVIDDYHFSIGADTTSFPAYIDDGVVTPNPRNVVVTIQDIPDQYQVLFANPLTQVVTGTLTWNTNLPDFTQGAAVNQAALPALVAYVNGLATGQQMNEFEMIAVVQAATAAVLPNQNLTRLIFTVSIDGVGVSPESGTGIYPSDTQSLLTASASAFVISQG